MAFDALRLVKPFETVSKATKSTGKLDDPKRVHKLRTNTRRIEATLAAMDVVSAARKKELLKALNKVRKAAGKVRDMDVLIGKAADVSVEGERNCQIRVLEFLGAERRRLGAELKDEIRSYRKELRKGLKKASRRLRTLLGAANEEQKAAEASAASRALEISAGLRRYRALNRRNLHEYRKQGKQLRYMLQMAQRKDEGFLTALTKVQDAIGEWHDWEELVGLAKQVLDHGRNCALIHELQLHAESSLDEALGVAASLRKRYLGNGAKRENAPAPLRIVRATASLAA
jgi:CHAD domain-containing protein